MSKFDVFSTKFANDIYLQKYSMNQSETWADTAKRVTEAVCNQLLDAKTKEKIFQLILERKFIPGGRYLYSSGRSFHQVNNCFDGETRILTDKGSFAFKDIVNEKVNVRNWKGEWEEAEVKSFGQQEVLKLTLSNGEQILTTANHLWIQPDGSRVKTTELKKVMLSEVSEFPSMDQEGIRHGIIYGDGYKHPNTGYTEIVIVNPKKDEHLVSYFENKEVEITVGFGAKRKYNTIRKVKAGTKIGLQPKHYKELPSHYTPEYARGFIAGLIATDGHASLSGSVLISCEGLEKAKLIRDIAVSAGCVVSSVRLSSKVNPYNGNERQLCNIYIKPFSAPIILPSHKNNTENKKHYKREMYLEVVNLESTEKVEEVFCVVAPKTHTFTLSNGVLTSNCFLFRAEDSRESWADTMSKATSALMTGGGIGIDYSNLRAEGAAVKRTGGKSTGPIALMHMVNEAGRHIMQGGQRRSAIWAGLNWKHDDVKNFLKLKDHSTELKAMKEKDFNFPLPMELTNISVIYDTEFFVAVENPAHPLHNLAVSVWMENCKQAFSSAEPGMSFNFCKDNESLRNACTEVTSEDDSDKCNLGTLWINRIKNKKELGEAAKLATQFLLCGSIYSDVPTQKIKEVGDKNNRIGLGLGGIHEWLMLKGSEYEVTPELHKWLSVYEQESDAAAFVYAKQLSVAVPKGVRAIAPTGTIGIIAETTTGIEPLFCKSYKRRYYKDGKWMYQYVVDGSVKRLMDQGVSLDKIKDSYDLTFKQRVKFQADVQNYVDMAISSTCNVASWGSEANNEQNLQEKADTLFKYAKRLRGFTVYPDGCRGGQPLTRVNLDEALASEGQVFEETERECLNGVCGI
jgi:ribonucleoside-diphosphate reductase alpha chain